MITPILRVLLASVGLAAVCASASAQLVAITHPSLTLSADEIRDVFLGDKQLAGSTKLVPIDNASAQEEFLAKVVRLDAAKYSTAWTKKSFRDGLSPPGVKATDGEVVDFVSRTTGAVGYIKTAPSAGVKAVELK
jgi:hypothetical protein